jgi:hypothetical protein
LGFGLGAGVATTFGALIGSKAGVAGAGVLDGVSSIHPALCQSESNWSSSAIVKSSARAPA